MRFVSIHCSKMHCGRGSAPDPAGGAYSAPQDLLAGFKGVPGEKGKGWEWKRKGERDREGGEGKGRLTLMRSWNRAAELVLNSVWDVKSVKTRQAVINLSSPADDPGGLWPSVHAVAKGVARLQFKRRQSRHVKRQRRVNRGAQFFTGLHRTSFVHR